MYPEQYLRAHLQAKMLEPQPRALFFDVFGTCVDWRSTVTDALHQACQETLEDADGRLSDAQRDTASQMTVSKWGEFAQAWRNGYKSFIMAALTNPDRAWQSVDEHHHESFIGLLKQWKLDNLWSDSQIKEMSLIWHYLRPWKDSVEGMRRLSSRFETSTLSNGNTALLQDLADFSKIPFKHLFSAEDFGAYKPSPKTYLGAGQKLRLEPDQCIMVAAHLNDLEAANKYGLKTAYVERPREEDWDEARVAKAKQEGWIDIWIEEKEEGFVALARALGIEN